MDISDVVTEIVEMLSNQADEKGVGLFTDLDDKLPAIAVDPDGMQQIILNLILNALDAVAPDKGVITAMTKYDSDKQELVLTISDTGMGIENNQLSGIFRAFYSSKGHGGTGLGLAVVKKIVEEHHGTIDIDSTKEEGTSFIIRIPAGKEELDSSSTAQTAIRTKGLLA